MAVADWNRDGRLDLVIGNIQGRVWFVPNESREGNLAFAANRSIEADGGEIQVSGDAGPLVADWDGDGVPDLLVGSGDGSVTLYRGNGSSGEPMLRGKEILIRALPAGVVPTVACERDPNTGLLRMPKIDRPGIRTKLAVVDWNGDGRPDLLVGDAVSARGPDRELNETQKKDRVDLEKENREVSSEISRIYDAARERAMQDLKDRKRGTDDPEFEEKMTEKTDEILSKDPHYEELESRAEIMSRRLAPYTPEYSMHGFVWVYLRK